MNQKKIFKLFFTTLIFFIILNVYKLNIYFYYFTFKGVIDVSAADFTGDSDGDGILDDGDNSSILFDNPCTGGATSNCDDNCTSLYNPEQTDLNSNGIGDACECEADFEGDGDVDALDIEVFLTDFGRSTWYRPCVPENPCNGDFDDDGDVDASDLSLLIEDYGRSKWNAPCPPCFFGPVEINLPPPAPPPDPRFIDHGNGTVTDTLTSLMWTKDAQLIPWKYQWDTAVALCADLVYPASNGYDDWRLPSVEEFFTLLDYSNNSPPLPSPHPFQNVLPFLYWTSSSYQPIYNHMVYVSMTTGHFYYHCRTAWGYVWPVRGPQ